MSAFKAFLVAYRGEYVPRDPVLFYPMEEVQEPSGVWEVVNCRHCDKSFRARRPTMCCSQTCADRLLGKETEPGRAPRIPTSNQKVRIPDAEAS